MPKAALENTLKLLGGKWKCLILWHLKAGSLRFGELRRGLDGVTQKMLTQQLRQLEADGIVSREVHRVVPPRVDYTLTERGLSLLPIVDRMEEWSRADEAGSEPKTESTNEMEVVPRRPDDDFPDWLD